MTEVPAIDQPVPDFSALSTDHANLTLSDLAGRFLVLYFYPRDNTPGCTQEGQDFRDHYAQFTELNAEVIGVSRDKLKTHENFKAKHDFPFPLITDPEESLCAVFGVMKQKNMYGKQVRGIERSTFLIDPDGVLRREWRKVKVPGHVQDVLAALAELSTGR
ncbi:MAG: peroxiredoxin [Methylococcales bacterium]|nr:peroxiredoxin [Methylococcales bacterium]